MADKQLLYHKPHSNDSLAESGEFRYNNVVEAHWFNMRHLLCTFQVDHNEKVFVDRQLHSRRNNLSWRHQYSV